MAAVSHWPAAAQEGLPFNNSNNKRNIGIPARGSDDYDNSDACSFEARSDVSGTRDDTDPAATARSGEAVRPDSLALTSPLEQLTRSLSFNKKDDSSTSSDLTKRNKSRARPAQNTQKTLPPVEQVMLEYLATEPGDKDGGELYKQPAEDDMDATARQSRPAINGRHPFTVDTTTFEPVCFSDDSHRTSGVEDVSDAQGQLINAFRSSYHTYMTRSGGLRDSSYSWMAPDGDSPNATMEFKYAGPSDANYLDESMNLGSPERYLSDNPTGGENSYVYSKWEGEDETNARRSSWDSQAARRMDLHRIPSEKTSKSPLDGRTRNVLTGEPFVYSSYESNLRHPREDDHRDQMRASNWTSLTDDISQQEDSTLDRPLSMVNRGVQSPSLYAYAVDSPDMMQRSFAESSRVASAVPIPLANRRQASRTNFSRPHDTLLSSANPVNNTQEQTHEQSEHLHNPQVIPQQYSTQQHSPLPYASDGHGITHPSRQPYDSMNPAYAQTSGMQIPRSVPQASFGGVAASRPEYLPSLSSQTTYTIQDMATSDRPDLRSLDSYATSSQTRPLGESGRQVMQTARHRRTPSQVLASAIAKHRSQRAAAGLTTEGQYYVDPKSQKHYFVADSGQAGGSALAKSKGKDGKESEKPKERRKLYKKEAGWQITKTGHAGNISNESTPHTAYEEQRDRSLSLSGRSTGSGKTSEDGHGGGSRWRLWSSNRSQGSKEHLPQVSPSQKSLSRKDASRQGLGDAADNSLELIAEVRALTGIAKMSSSPGTRHHNVFAADPSPRTADPPMHNSAAQSPSGPSQGCKREGVLPSEKHHPSFDQKEYAGSSTSHLHPSGASPGHPSHHTQPPNLERLASVYSDYSYYGVPTDQIHVSSTGASPVSDRFQANIQTESSPYPPLDSPYITPQDARFQPTPNSHTRQPSTTLDKAKHSIIQSGSLQLLAPSKHQHLTVPKGDASHQLNLTELARQNPNDPLVCLHLGIDAHERGDLEDSARLFEKSAKGGCGLGMLMFGLTLRHGWGCISDPEAGFQYLQRAAESVVENLDRVISGHIQLSEQQIEEQSAKSELVLSIYELGQCFLRGWGVAKDKKIALQYFTLAANLGDPDAQSELGFCYSAGRGCKKDLKKAAKYYRMAAKQGQISYGMQWIYKAKYDD